MTDKLNWEHSGIEDTAALLMKINPHFPVNSLASAVSYIKNHVERGMDAPGYLSTLGFVATVWADDEFNLHVKMSVAPYTVARYLAGR